MDKHADPHDEATENEEEFKISSIKAARKFLEAPAHFDGATCIACEEDIPQGRIDIGCFRCIFCQVKFERGVGI